MLTGGVRCAQVGLRFMARKLRIQYPGAIYHVVNRGDHQELIFSGVETYRWSSYPLYQSDTGPRPPWLRVDRLLGEWGIRWDQPGAGREFSALMEARRRAELEQEFKPLPRGWCASVTLSRSTSPPSSGRRPRSRSVGLRSGWRWEHAGIWRTCFIAREGLRLRLHSSVNRFSIYDIIIDLSFRPASLRST